MKPLQDDHRVQLASWVDLLEDRVRGRWILNGPERVIVLDDIAKDILELCDGTQTLSDIREILGRRYAGEAAIIEKDVRDFLHPLIEKRYLDVR